MNTSYPYSTDDGWRDWALPTSEIIEAEAEKLGVPVALAGAMRGAAEAFGERLAVARAPETQGKAATARKNDALESLKLACRRVVARIDGNLDLPDAERVRLGLKPFDRTPTPATAPARAPTLGLLLTGPTSVRALVRDPADPDRLAKPKGVRSIVVLAALTDEGEAPPSDPAAWTLLGQQGRSNFDLSWPELTAPKTVWVTCHWVTTRNEASPSAPPAKLVLPGNGLGPAAKAAASPTMKIAA